MAVHSLHNKGGPLRPIFVLLLLAGAVGGDAANDATVPTIVKRVGSSEPFFISAAAATGADGRMNLAVFPEASRLYFEAKRVEAEKRRDQRSQINADAIGEQPCPVRVVTFPHFDRPSKSWSDLTQHSEAIYRGRVSETVAGFEGTRPVTLVVIEIVNTVRVSTGYPTAGTIRILHHGADFRIGGQRFCVSSPNDGVTPSVGDEVLVMAYSKPIDESGTLIRTAAEQVIVSRGDRLFLPATLRGDASLPPALSLDALVESVARPGTERRPKQ
jgi:hypothetical protein